MTARVGAYNSQAGAQIPASSQAIEIPKSLGPNYRVWQLAESYLNVVGKVYTIGKIEDKSITLIEEDKNRRKTWQTALKIVSYVTVILPLLALCVRNSYRCKHTFTFLNLTSREKFYRCYEALPKEKERRDCIHLLDYVVKGYARKELNLSGILCSGKTYQQHLPDLVKEAYGLLNDIAKDPNAHLKRGCDFYKMLAAFYRNHAKNPLRSDEVFVREIIKDLKWQNSDHFELHQNLWTLMQRLRKEIKLHCKTAKIKEKFGPDVPLELMTLTWLHGSKSHVVSEAVQHTEGKLVPSGKLRKSTFSGEMCEGAFEGGINSHALSGVTLSGAKTAIEYANSYVFDPKMNKLMYERFFQLRITKLDDVLNRGELTSLYVAMQRMASYEPEVFNHDKERIGKKIVELEARIEEVVFTQRPKEIFGWHDAYYTSKFYKYLKILDRMKALLVDQTLAPLTDQKKVELQESFPVIFATNKAFGVPWQTEDLYEGSLELGTEITHLIVPAEKKTDAEALLHKNRLQGKIKVFTFDDLKKATKVDEACHDYFYHFMKRK